VTVTGGQGCTGVGSATVAVNSLPTASIGGDLSLCPGGNNELTAAGGEGYLWNTGAQTASITASSAGAYSVTVTDANGCTDTESIQVQALQAPTAMITGSTSFCTGGSTELTATGGTGYAWSTGAQTAAVTVSNQGAYTVTVTADNGCTGSATATVAQNNAPSVQITGDLQICSNETTTLTATAGASYSWSTGATGQSVNVSTAGNYTVTVTADNGCTGTASATVAVNSLPTASIGGDLSLCPGGNNELTAAGGEGYLWNTGAQTASITASSAGAYSVTVTDGNGCTDTESVQVQALQAPPAMITGSTSFCTGESTELTASGGTGYAWSTGAQTAAVTVSVAGDYTVTVTDANGCTGTATAVVEEVTSVAVTISGETDLCAGESATLTATAGISYA
jgi:hypothetical protein